MSGHSKWNNIKGRKGKADKERGKLFSKIGRELLMAVKEGGADINANSKLRDVIAKAKSNNMPNDTIDKAIKKASGEDKDKMYEEVVYEGYGIGGVAVIVNGSTDNKNRTAAEVRHVFDKFGGNLGTTGCVSYLFNKKGVIIIEKGSCKLSEEDLMLQAIDLGAEDFEASEEYYEITTAPEDFSNVREGLEKQGIEFEQAEVQMLPTTYITLDSEQNRRMNLIIENLEELDDVLEIFHNWEENEI